MRTNGQIIKSTITSTLDQTALNYQQVDKFTEMAYESTEFLKGIRTVNKISSKGTIDKIGVTGRNLRSKVENKEATNTAAPTFPQVPYAVAPVVLPFEITEEFIRQTQRVRGQNAEEIIMAAMTKNYGDNMQDIGFNGDTATPNTDPDYAFLSINDGWLKLAKTKGNFIDWTTLPDVKKKASSSRSSVQFLLACAQVACSNISCTQTHLVSVFRRWLRKTPAHLFSYKLLVV